MHALIIDQSKSVDTRTVACFHQQPLIYMYLLLFFCTQRWVLFKKNSEQKILTIILSQLKHLIQCNNSLYLKKSCQALFTARIVIIHN